MSLKDAYLLVKEYIRRKKGKLEDRPFIEEIIEDLMSSPANYVINAPTGYGKTAISISVALDSYNDFSKTIIAYPLRSLIEEQVRLFREVFEFAVGDGRIVGSRYMGKHDSPYLINPVTLTTVDTLSLTALGLSPEDIHLVLRNYSSEEWFRSLGHYIFSWSSVYSSSFIVLDEVHLFYDTTKSLSFLYALLDMCESLDVRVLMMSATLPKSFEGILKQKGVSIKRFQKDHDPRFYEERLSKNYRINGPCGVKRENKMEFIRKILCENDFKKALVIFNTVEDAVEFYKSIDGDKLLIHSRFSVEDREKKLEQLKKLEDSSEKFILVSTQVIEAGVDFSSDLIVTEIAPPISLVQRFGRFLRRSEKKGDAFIWYEEEALEKSFYKVYDGDLVKRTIDYLLGNNDINLHVGYDDFLDRIYNSPPRVNSGLISSIRSTLWNLLEPSSSALELLIKHEGSFVRESSLARVVTENGVELNVSYEYLMKLKKEGKCMDCPNNIKEAVIKSLSGHAFRVKVNYDEEFGLA